MQIHQNIQIIDLAIYLPKHQTIIFSDFHIGYEEMLNARGILIPRFQFKDTIARLEKIFEKIKEENKNKNAEEQKLKKIIINGDLKHEFGTIHAQEWREILKLFDFFSQKAEKIIVVKGNHDVMLGPIARKRDVEVVVDYMLDGILISHGDAAAGKEKLKQTKTIIIGHDHPAIAIKERNRKETFKCFVKGKFKNKTLIVQPSFNVLVEGTDILNENFLSPYLQQSLNNFEVFVVAKPLEILYFGKVKNLK